MDTFHPPPGYADSPPLIRPRGRVLDLAAGGGRHTALLREHRYQVTAVDRDISALAAAFADDPGCAIRTLDLEDGAACALGQDYDGIVVANYLHRPLFPALIAALAPGGILLYETFAAGNERFGRPSNPELLLRPGELLAAFGTALTVIAFEQGVVDQPRPAVVQRIAAAKGSSPLPLPPAAASA
ncbi:MAG TPA: methyltransferase domain-containing protein [Stellaceae bacterium]|nr:methyltransferase domain-containing protein [Stellaceae bacterium]